MLFPNIELLEKEVAEGFINVTQHPKTSDLLIYNYSPQAQYSKRWNEATLTCRGLILDNSYGIVARPFRKFFNYTEVATPKFVWGSPATLYEKLDGSLGIIYPFDGGYQVATRGSFVSDQASWASDHLVTSWPNFSQPVGVTTLVEIIYPDNRIVVDYKGESKLVLLGAVDNETGVDIPVWEIDWWDGEVAEHYGHHSIDAAYSLATGNDFVAREGVVAVWYRPGKPAYRLKIKHPEYLRLHRLLTGVSNRTVWLYLAVSNLKAGGHTDKKQLCKTLKHNPEQIQEILDVSGDPLESLLDNVPDEFYDWVTKTRTSLEDEFHQTLNFAYDVFWDCIKPFTLDLNSLPAAMEYCKKAGRKEFVAAVDNCGMKFPGLVFGILDGRDITPEIWKMIKPERQLPFQTEDTDEN